jgi:uncharacterized protein (DUF1919 family)
MYAEIQMGEYIETETFVTDEGYSWNMHIYPKGTREGDGKSIAMYAYQVASVSDSQRTWPLYGKQVRYLTAYTILVDIFLIYFFLN